MPIRDSLTRKGAVLKHLSIRQIAPLVWLFFALITFSNQSVAQSFSQSLLNKQADAPSLPAAARQDFLPPEQVFKPEIFKASESEINLIWEINPDYYLYKDKIHITPLNQNVDIAEIIWPDAVMHDDEFFGRQPIYNHTMEMTLRFKQPLVNVHTLHLEIEAQGCAKAGLCFPPHQWSRTLVVNPDVITADQLKTETATPLLNEHDRLASFLLEKQYLALPLFFLLGILLTFTPCVLPMLPILSGILTGEKNLTKRRGFMISFSYVIAMALVYTTIGIVAAMLGSGLAAAFQNKYVLMGFAALFVILSLSMFGVYQIQTPVFIQNYLNRFASQSKSGTYIGAMIMGALSALIVGPCVTAPLIGIITLIAQTQDYVLGGFALFAMSLGMGVPLMILGVSSGYLLPKAGAWMNAIKEFFGFILLAVAAYFLGRILPLFWENMLYAFIALSLALWFVIKIFKMHQLPKFFVLPALLSLAFSGYFVYESLKTHESLAATPIVGLKGLNEALQNNHGKITLLEFNADWCVACKEMEKYVFSDPEVKARLAELNFITADVTENNKVDQQLQKHFNLFGPPAMLFFDAAGNEIPQYRVMGAVPADQFIEHLDYILKNN